MGSRMTSAARLTCLDAGERDDHTFSQSATVLQPLTREAGATFSFSWNGRRQGSVYEVRSSVVPGRAVRMRREPDREPMPGRLG